MKLPLKWLNEYVKITVTPKELSDAMTMSGSKVEGFEKEGTDIEGVVVGQVKEIHPHTGADSLVITTVDTGDEVLSIVTGATNLTVGDYVPVAKVGSTVAGGKAIGKAEFRGVDSYGMLCSVDELGLDINSFPYADPEGIFVLGDDCEHTLGMDIGAAIGLDDTVVEFEITPNRSDCLAVTGLAREVAATYGGSFTPKTPQVKGGGADISDYLSVTVENTTLCPRYMARVITDIKLEPSPRWMRERLRASGVRPINNVVDVTNYVMLEFGEPLHAFDYSCLGGKQIVVRNAAEGENITTLDGTERALTTDMLVIADGEKPSAVAGVMGGLNSSITADTKVVVLEAANFLGSSVRTTSRKLGMRTESSGRFEKGLDRAVCETALQRACELYEQLGVGTVCEGIIDVSVGEIPPRPIVYSHDWVNGFLNTSLTREYMDDILLRIGFTVDGDTVYPPTFRQDVEGKADIAEEIVRFYGYDKIETTVPKTGGSGSLTTLKRVERTLVKLLTSRGLNECVTPTFISPKVFEKLGIPNGDSRANCVKILNPLGEDTGLLRNDVLPSMLSVLSSNHSVRNENVHLFEISTEFIPKDSPTELPIERPVLAIGMYGKDAEVLTLKGYIEEIMGEFRVKSYKTEVLTDEPYYHPGRTAQFTADGKTIAIFGELHPDTATAFDMEGMRICYAKVYLSELVKATDNAVKYKTLPKFPAMLRDIALVVDEGVTVGALNDAIVCGGGELLEKSELFDIYRGAQLGEGKKSVAFTLAFRSDRTLNDEIVEGKMSSIMDEVAKLGAVLRA